jgi:hypothetical protein
VVCKRSKAASGIETRRAGSSQVAAGSIAGAFGPVSGGSIEVFGISSLYGGFESTCIKDGIRSPLGPTAECSKEAFLGPSLPKGIRGDCIAAPSLPLWPGGSSNNWAASMLAT